jgi:hypothetical protein
MSANMTDEQIILKDIKEISPHGQNSWDWPADYRFAKEVGTENEIEILKALLKSNAPFAHQIAIHKLHITKLKNRRLKALRNLQKQGIIESWWIGTGFGGKNEFGVSRIKTWHLI